MTTHLILNAASGPASDRAAIEQAIAAAGLSARPTWVDGGNVADLARQALDRGATTVVAGGGDGTLSSVAAVLAGTGMTMGILPLGTLNHFARDLGIPADIGEAAQVVAAGKVRQVDVAEVNGHLFLNNSAIGLYPLMVVDRDLQRRRLGRTKKRAMIVASIRTFARFKHQRLRLTVNDREESVETPLLFVGNNDYRVDIIGRGSRASLQDGELFVLVMRSTSRLGLVAATLRALFNRTRSGDMVQLTGVTSLRVTSRRSHLPVAVDGEVVGMASPLDYTIRPRALNVIVP
ncbi:sphingosine kinase [Sphingomonas sabuli]|uniref:Sphingosine kinase n=1 Tax=Sphingomonas sabuli TaxID=2764186 RepID=A0A7G9L5I9_9SPHN|nr:diacylglycerol kinase family protein [Sphingomonas sabuli]QNM83888.1 sphingosine kinase [Sphingomonas sabuli]